MTSKKIDDFRRTLTNVKDLSKFLYLAGTPHTINATGLQSTGRE